MNNRFQKWRCTESPSHIHTAEAGRREGDTQFHKYSRGRLSCLFSAVGIGSFSTRTREVPGSASRPERRGEVFGSPGPGRCRRFGRASAVRRITNGADPACQSNPSPTKPLAEPARRKGKRRRLREPASNSRWGFCPAPTERGLSMATLRKITIAVSLAALTFASTASISPAYAWCHGYCGYHGGWGYHHYGWGPGLAFGLAAGALAAGAVYSAETFLRRLPPGLRSLGQLRRPTGGQHLLTSSHTDSGPAAGASSPPARRRQDGCTGTQAYFTN